MMIEKFWWVIERAGWADEIRKGTKRAYETCGERLVQLLPTVEERVAFEKLYRTCHRQLSNKINRWEEERASRRMPLGEPLGDDSFDDLVAMIIGLGQAEYEKTMADPSHAWQRATRGYGSVDSYVESFSYCLHSLKGVPEAIRAKHAELSKELSELYAQKKEIEAKIASVLERF